jgi:hypothetical protein
VHAVPFGQPGQPVVPQSVPHSLPFLTPSEQDWQLVVPHTYGAVQVVWAPGTQLPLPLQASAAYCTLPLHEALPHWVPEGWYSQAPALQTPVVPQLVEEVAVHSALGSVPSVTLAQVPVVWPVSAAVHA